jgi:hypothetical protein
MQVTIGGMAATDLPANWEKDVVLGRERPEISGSVIDTDAAADKFLVHYRIVCLCFVAFVWLVLYALAASAPSGDRQFIGRFALVMAVVMPIVFVMIYFIRRKRLYDSLPERARASPPPGTVVRVDPSGLSVGDRVAAWNDVDVDNIDFELLQGRYGSRTYLVHQVAVRTRDFSCVLDGLLIDQGPAILNEIYRHKYRRVD